MCDDLGIHSLYINFYNFHSARMTWRVCFVFRLYFIMSHLKVSAEPEQDSVLNSKKLTSKKKLYFVLLNYIRVIDSLPGRKAERSPPPTKPTPIAISC